jgi:hypothetical protein
MLKCFNEGNFMKAFVSFLILLSFDFCVSSDKKGDGYVYVKNSKGINLEDAELNAKRDILAKGLGELVEGNTEVNSGQLVESMVASSVEGYVFDYSQLGKERIEGPLTVIDARGKVDRGSLQSLIESLNTIQGKPNFLMIIDETIETRKSTTTVATENAMVSNFPEFTFLDREQFRRLLAKEGGKTIGVYGDPSAEAKATEVAAQMDADILLIGQTTVKNAGPILDSGMNSFQASIKFKLISVGNAQIIAADNAGGGAPHIDADRGAGDAINKSLVSARPKILDQLKTKWKRGASIRLVIDGMSYDEFLDKDIGSKIRKFKGVNTLNDKGSGNSNNSLVIEIQANFNGTQLYRKMRERKEDLGINFTQKEVKPNTVRIQVTK